MLKIRLQRVGRKNDPSFRLVVTEHTNAAKKSGRFAEILGSYDARHAEPVIKAERVNHWLSMGAQPSVTAHNLLIRTGVLKAKTKNPLPKKTPLRPEATEGQAAIKEELPKEEVADKVVEEVTPVETI